jgi:hypothetical protein
MSVRESRNSGAVEQIHCAGSAALASMPFNLGFAEVAAGRVKQQQQQQQAAHGSQHHMSKQGCVQPSHLLPKRQRRCNAPLPPLHVAPFCPSLFVRRCIHVQRHSQHGLHQQEAASKHIFKTASPTIRKNIVAQEGFGPFGPLPSQTVDGTLPGPATHPLRGILGG